MQSPMTSPSRCPHYVGSDNGTPLKNAKERYISGKYLAHNPTWDEAVAPWKAEKIYRLLRQYQITPESVCEVGCGSGAILAELRHYWGPDCRLVGYDIAPSLVDFWHRYASQQLDFRLADFPVPGKSEFFEVLLIIDVLEHLENPFEFLRQALSQARWFVFHIPLDLHAQGAIRTSTLLRAHHQTGHLHYWNKDLALTLLGECGLKVIHWEYTAGSVELPTASRARRLASWPRRWLYALAPDLAVRLLGGYSLLALASVR